MQTIQTKRDSLPYQTEKVMQGILEGKSDETVGEIAAVISDFLVFGDLRDLSIQGMHYLKNEETDNFLVALSSLGLIATVSTAYTAGASSPIKGSISFLKYAKRANKIPLWFQTKLMKQIDIAKDKKSLINVQTLLTPIHKLYDKTGFTQAMNLMSKSRNIKELTLLSKFGTRFKKKSQVLLSTSNNTAIKYMQKMPNVSTKNFLYASTYGEQGLKGMHKLGTNKFMKRVGFNSNLAKTTYKGNLNALFNALLKNIPNSLLYAISLFGLFYFIRKFFTLKKKLFS
ncbi:MAG: Unknown protein [uncultured Sulfurovum sp.]|uniref:Uncharacterized protein n=1 Tax=uncultured Sulfurovum sp. TaxID=269237 RepID=A0A6S6TQS3_9BACT|nr:MAG: Unknown protein [uncultured Sulfurovum sp.]